ncbi:MAG TPA: ABC transporter permease [Chryseolinea sp.]|nr:ABC transporter permease [Chryseolinea sp.]
MILANLQFSFRYLRKNKITTSIHVAGLSLGITVCMLIALFIHHQMSFDSFHDRASRTYRVNAIFNEGGTNFDMYATPLPLSATLRNDYAAIESSALVRPLFKTVVEVHHELFKEERIMITSPEFFDIFNISMIRGHGRASMVQPYQAIISESISKRFFGLENPIGKTIKLRGEFEYTVAGVMRDAAPNTSLPASILLSYTEGANLLDHGDTWYFGDFAWVKLQAITYVVLKPGVDPADVEKQLTRLADKQINSVPALNQKIHGQFSLQPLSEIHFDTTRFGGGPWVRAQNRMWLWFFAGIGGLVLILACVNFLNLATAKASTRAKEVGIRKSIGALRRQLITQFLTESFLLIFAATLISLLAVSLCLQQVNNLLQQSLSIGVLLSLNTISTLVAAMTIASLLAGFYPALFISRLNPIETLKANFAVMSSRTAAWVRRSLVAFQFVISGVLIIAVLAISQQLEFMLNKDLGFERDNILTVEVPQASKGKVVADEILRVPGVKDVCLSRTAPISTDHWWNTISQTSTSDQRFSVCAIYGNEKFYSFYGLKILTGRVPDVADFIPDSVQSESSVYRVVVNEKLLNVLNLGSPEEALGKQFWWGGIAEVVGVVADFNAEPLKYGISPTLITQQPDLFGQVNIKLDGGTDQAETINHIQQKWSSVFPDEVFEVVFLDRQIQSFYGVESKIFQLFRIFALMAVSISCLGLWGLVAFTASTRTKEMGIRKVLGASVKVIAWLLSRDVFATLLLALLIAVPLAYLLVGEMLKSVAYRTEIGWLIFVNAAAVITAAVVLTIGAQVLRAASANPIDVLKRE